MSKVIAKLSSTLTVEADERGQIAIWREALGGKYTSITIHDRAEDALLAVLLERKAERDRVQEKAEAEAPLVRKLKWGYQEGESAKAYRWYEAVLPNGDRYQVEAKWSNVYEGRVDAYRVFFRPAGGDFDSRVLIGKDKYLANAKTIAQEDLAGRIAA